MTIFYTITMKILFESGTFIENYSTTVGGDDLEKVKQNAIKKARIKLKDYGKIGDIEITNASPLKGMIVVKDPQLKR